MRSCPLAAVVLAAAGLAGCYSCTMIFIIPPTPTLPAPDVAVGPDAVGLHYRAFEDTTPRLVDPDGDPVPATTEILDVAGRDLVLVRPDAALIDGLTYRLDLCTALSGCLEQGTFPVSTAEAGDRPPTPTLRSRFAAREGQCTNDPRGWVIDVEPVDGAVLLVDVDGDAVDDPGDLFDGVDDIVDNTFWIRRGSRRGRVGWLDASLRFSGWADVDLSEIDNITP